MNKKSVASAYAWVWIIVAFLLTVIFFFAMFSVLRNQVEHKVESEFAANNANLIINNFLYTPVVYEGREMTMAELLDDYQRSGQRANWIYEPKQAEFINMRFIEYLESVYGEDVEWKLQIRFDDESKSHALYTVTYGTLRKTGPSILQVIPSYNKKNIIIEFWPPK